MSKIISNMLKMIHEKINLPSLSIYIENFIAKIRRVPVRFFYDKEDALFFVKGEGEFRFFSNAKRGFSLYRSGIIRRGRFLNESYCLSNIDFKNGDVVIDCGANHGDLFLSLSKMVNAKDYYAIEPNPSDFKALKRNLKNCNLYNLALGKEEGEMEFYIATADGDSSLIIPDHYDEKINVLVKPLNKFVKEVGVRDIKLLKVEAEGYEPEIFEGSLQILKHCEYICVDGGYERRGEQTLTDVTNTLINKGFEMIDIYPKWCRALYKNKNYEV